MLCPCSAETGSRGKPRLWNSASSSSSFSRPSTLLTTQRVGRPMRRMWAARYSSRGSRPSRPSTTKATAQASFMAASAWRRMSDSKPRMPSGPSVTMAWASRVMPPVSTMPKSGWPLRRTTPSMRSRVTPGRSWVMARLLRIRRLNRVDLPTLGRPTRTMQGNEDMGLPSAMTGRCCGNGAARGGGHGARRNGMEKRPLKAG